MTPEKTQSIGSAWIHHRILELTFQTNTFSGLVIALVRLGSVVSATAGEAFNSRVAPKFFHTLVALTASKPFFTFTLAIELVAGGIE